MYECFSRGMADFIKGSLSLTADDQIIDVGGGTAQVSLMVKEDVGMTKPVVCIDPSMEMLSVAQKNGAITIKSSAEDFFASKPDYPLKVVFINGCIHHFEKPDFVFSKLASYMPDDGVCIVCMCLMPLFKAEKDTIGKDRFENIFKCIDFESKGLKCVKSEGPVTGEMDKQEWYQNIRKRLSSYLVSLSDEELEEGIKRLEEEYKDQTSLKLVTTVQAYVITRK